jgi:hypothetical protein
VLLRPSARADGVTPRRTIDSQEAPLLVHCRPLNELPKVSALLLAGAGYGAEQHQPRERGQRRRSAVAAAATAGKICHGWREWPENEARWSEKAESAVLQPLAHSLACAY